eukprot:4838463-Pyramimonas_sp.AAC.1
MLASDLDWLNERAGPAHRPEGDRREGWLDRLRHSRSDFKSAVGAASKRAAQLWQGRCKLDSWQRQ